MKEIRNYILLFIFMMVFQNNWGQQTALYPEYNYNPFIINSAYTGMSDGAEITLSNYGYINSIEGSPRTLSLSFHTPIARKKMGIGGAIIRDKIGVSTYTNAYASYSYKIFFDTEIDRPYWQHYNEHVISFGLTAGVQQFHENLLELGITDDIEFSENMNVAVPTVGIGFLYNHADFYAGISLPNLLGDKLASRDDLNISNPIYGYFGYRFFTNRFEEVMIKPSVFLKYEGGAPMQIDANVAVNYKNKFEIGTGYRSSSSINFLAGIYALKNLKFVYFYNAAFSDSVLGNSHGVILSYVFEKKRRY
ncbi:PorP/SprF family type IX secretion system membrane protein [Tenacibaculum mesophilum]|uniref:PorP/SprF family type IX secretion system membrane protein n=1 Tax=Tenacibaculum mesophilum TaxID=104268 RepID=A0AAE9SGZ5_9FLAO|nr:PorP/SprF family type IX secretion system membrane protein [Tenacibaculum mesophilum]UTD15329.1 PorP/SprF family type IX secretion system membrane protein [Tenacibaculum mesophilum]